MLSKPLIRAPKDTFASSDGSVLFAMSDFLDPGSGPDQSGDFRVSPSFYLVLPMVGVFGHIIKSKTLVALGIALVFAATVALPVALPVALALSN
jgi:hypothetical protein